MKFRMPDIKTVDAFYEVFSDLDKTLKQIETMRGIRDEIKGGLELTDTKERIGKQLGEAGKKMTEAQVYGDQMRADIGMAEARLAANIEKHEETTLKDREWIATTKMKLSTDRGQFTRTSTALKKDLDDRLENVEKREEEVRLGKLSLAESKKEHEAYVKGIKAVM